MQSSKLKVTFMLAPKITTNFAPGASRIISTNLVRNKKLDVQFSDFALRLYHDYIENERYKHYFHEGDMLNTYGKLSLEYTKYGSQLYNFVKIPKHVYQVGIDEIETDYVIVSAVSIFSFSFVKQLIESGKKVILGGAAINTYPNVSYVRQYFKDMNTDLDKLNDNLIIVQGFVDLNTDFYEIIKEWKDVGLPKAMYGTIYDCDYDYLMESKYSPNVVVLPLSEGCYWGKCTYCDIFNGRENKVDIFYNDHLAKKIQNNINTIVKNYPNCDCLNLHENYLSQKTLDFINNYIDFPSKITKLYGYTGIKFLTNDRYTESFRDLSRGRLNVFSLLGADGVNDFVLSQCNRGFSFRDIEQALINIGTYLNKRFHFGITVIKDLPIKNYLEVYKSNAYYENIYNFLQGYVRGVFNVNYLILYPNSKMTQSVVNGSNKYMKLLKNPLDLRSSGIHYFLNKYLKDYNSMIDPVIRSLVPFYRVDEYGGLLPQDDEIQPFHGV